MFTKKVLSQQSGFSLIQVMVALAVGGILVMFLADSFIALNKAQGRARLSGDIVSAMEDARRSLVRTRACTDTLASGGAHQIPNYGSEPLQLSRIVDEFGDQILSLGSLPTNSNLEIKQIGAKLNENTPLLLANSILVVDISVMFETKSFSFGSQLWNRTISVTVETDDGKNVTSCNSLTMADRVGFEKATCKSFNGTMNGDVCDLSSSESIVKAACKAIGLKSNGKHCAY